MISMAFHAFREWDGVCLRVYLLPVLACVCVLSTQVIFPAASSHFGPPFKVPEWRLLGDLVIAGEAVEALSLLAQYL
jgi:hypothetical protein